eukprot:TRINITY_DN40098_c0_g1_i1.p1 TRINITY_DN40098_c0_g1~~TRINITY_DN40098_c0_g1_i1.p1  ORF type:complete len:571 (-),score=116.91 TRINITY_DN40098_c0_g1_i1:82-1794(-)
MEVGNSRGGKGGGFDNKVAREEFDRHVQDLHGKTNQLRTQMTEMYKTMKKIPTLDNATQMSKVTQQMNGIQQQLAQYAQTVQQVQAENMQGAQVRNEVNQLKNELAQLGQVRGELAQVKAELAQAGQLRSELSQMKNELAQAGQWRTEIQQVKRELAEAQQLRNEFTKMQNESNSATRELTSIKNELNQNKKAVQEVKGMKQDIDEAKRGMETAKSLQKEVNSLKDVKTKSQAHERDLNELKRNTRDFDRVKSDVGVTASEFNRLKQTLNDLGVLKPPKVEVAPDQPPPVGTIALGEDCFTASMLIKLGYMKVRQEERDAEELDARALAIKSDSESDESIESAIITGMDNVHGLMAPEIQEGAKGYTVVTCLFNLICAATLFLQIFIVGCLVHYAIEPTECFDHEPDAAEWWILHVSKAFAVLCAGAFMAKDFMDIVNSWMVSVLLTPHIDKTIAFINVMRFMLTILIGVANVMMFEGMVSPMSVWVNMAALAFVGELGAAVIDQAKKGVFGHAIRSTITTTNYELTFVADYPWWIAIVQAGTLLFISIFVAVSAMIVFTADDVYCAKKA